MAEVPRYSRDDVARRGDETYECEILPHLGPEDEGKLVLIDVVTGAYEMDRDEVAASDRLLARYPDAQVWMREAGSRYGRRLRSPHSAVEEHASLDEAELILVADQVFLDLDRREKQLLAQDAEVRRAFPGNAGVSPAFSRYRAEGPATEMNANVILD